jgi:ABC-type tungstate transport system substrate-binding protein
VLTSSATAPRHVAQVRLYTMQYSAAMAVNASASLAAALTSEQFRTQYNLMVPVKDMLSEDAVLVGQPMV